MRKYIPYVVSFIITLQALTPPFDLGITFTHNPIHFVWAFLFCGILSFYYIFTKANVWLKVLIPFLFVNSFLSKAPFLSMTSFVWVIVCAYFYLLCLEVGDWRPIFKTVWSLIALEILLVWLKIFHKETLLNFGTHANSFIGTVGNVMQYKSLILILMALAMQSIKKLEKYTIWIFASLCLMAIAYFFQHNVARYFLYARGDVWFKSIQLSFQHPLLGWGLGTFKAIFPTLATGGFQVEGQWTNAHNFLVQIFFEAGMVGVIATIGYWISLFHRSSEIKLLGLLLVTYTLMFHFPERQVATIPLLILFLAYIERKQYASITQSTCNSEFSTRTS